MITTVLFDLDGTLLPMDQNQFMEAYFGLMVKKMAEYGYEPKQLVKSIWDGTMHMVKNDGSKTNEDVFWDRFNEIYGEDIKEKHHHIFEDYYLNNFPNVKAVCGFNPDAKATVLKLKEAGLRVALATNPIFPRIATEERIRWTGLTPSDFELYTTYENEKYAKPNPKYYLDILKRLDVLPQECIMVGNDVQEDMIAAELGMKVFLITDTLINKTSEDISHFPQGSFNDLIDYINKLNKE